MATIRAIVSWLNPRRRIIAAVLIGWVALVIIGSGRPADSNEWVSLPDLGGLFVALVGLAALIGLALLIFMRPNTQGGRRPRTKQSLRTLLVVAALMIALAVSFGPQEVLEEDAPVEEETAQTSESGDLAVIDNGTDASSDIDIVALVIVGVLAGAVLLRSWLRKPPGTPIHEGADGRDRELEAAIEAATQHLQLGTDPRSAVLAAYDSLERALAERGHHRDRAETPTEHMSHVLADVPALAGPAARLGRLYELARFSDHPITEADRLLAAEELTAARHTLMAVPVGTL